MFMHFANTRHEKRFNSLLGRVGFHRLVHAWPTDANGLDPDEVIQDAGLEFESKLYGTEMTLLQISY